MTRALVRAGLARDPPRTLTAASPRGLRSRRPRPGALRPNRRTPALGDPNQDSLSLHPTKVDRRPAPPARVRVRQRASGATSPPFARGAEGEDTPPRVLHVRR